jgi:hypothetical protein
VQHIDLLRLPDQTKVGLRNELHVFRNSPRFANNEIEMNLDSSEKWLFTSIPFAIEEFSIQLNACSGYANSLWDEKYFLPMQVETFSDEFSQSFYV